MGAEGHAGEHQRAKRDQWARERAWVGKVGSAAALRRKGFHRGESPLFGKSCVAGFLRAECVSMRVLQVAGCLSARVFQECE
jgi:hypothetical protein